MKNMDFIRLGKRALSLSLLLTMISATSMFALAASTKPIGELIVTGGNSDGASVTVNGEPAKSGRTVFASSTITTPDGVTVVLNMGKAGKIELAPNTTFSIDGDASVAQGNLTAGKVTVLHAPQGVNVKNLTGETVTLISGEGVDAESSKRSQQTTPKPGTVVLPIIGAVSIWALVVAGGFAVLATGIIVADQNDDNRGNSISPIR